MYRKLSEIRTSGFETCERTDRDTDTETRWSQCFNQYRGWVIQELRSVGLTYIHTCRSYVHTQGDFINSASVAWRLRRRIATVMFTCEWAWPALADSSDFGLLGNKIPQMGDSLPWTPMNRRAKFDAANFIIGMREIRNRTNTDTHTQTNNKRYIHTLPTSMWRVDKMTSVGPIRTYR